MGVSVEFRLTEGSVRPGLAGIGNPSNLDLTTASADCLSASVGGGYGG